jgi:hypothetical protein
LQIRLNRRVYAKFVGEPNLDFSGWWPARLGSASLTTVLVNRKFASRICEVDMNY